MKKLFIVFMAALMSMGISAVSAMADDSGTGSVIDRSKRGTVTISYADDADGKESVAGAAFRLYKAAAIGNEGEKVPIIDGIAAEDITGDGLQRRAEAERIIVSAYEKDPGVGKTYSGKTDNEGILQIKDMEQGVYLVKEITPARYHYPTSSFFISIPYTDAGKDGQVWCYDVNAEAKPNIAGDLIIEKIIKGNNAEKDRQWHFTVDIDSEMEFEYEKTEGGKGIIRSGDTIELKGGEKATVKMIPQGAAYKVTEKEAGEDGYLTVAVNEKGSIKGKGTVKSTFTNAKTDTAAAKSGGSGKKASTQKTPKTGDGSPVGELICIIAACVTAAVFLLKRKKRLIKKAGVVILAAFLLLQIPANASAVSGPETETDEMPAEDTGNEESVQDAEITQAPGPGGEETVGEDAERPEETEGEKAEQPEETDESVLDKIYDEVTESDIEELIEKYEEPDEINPIEEIYGENERDEGILQMAAFESGIIGAGDDTVKSGDGTEKSGDEDGNGRQNGDTVEYEPGTGMAKLSSFMLADTRDGAGDFDSDDSPGNDTSDHNGRIRVHDDIIYTFVYSTFLCEEYIYKTVKGGTVYIACVMPEGTTTEDGFTWSCPGGNGDYVSLPDGRQAFVCRVDLGDGDSPEGEYDIPGVGRTEIVLRVESQCEKDSIEPEFFAWLDDGINNDITGDCVIGAGSPETVITSAPFADVIWYDTSTTHKTRDGLIYTSYNVVDDTGRKTTLTGRRNRISYRIIAQKPNGHVQGVKPVGQDAKIVFTFSSVSEQSTGTGGTADGMSTVYTRSTGDRNSSNNAYSAYEEAYEEAVPEGTVHSNGYIASAGYNDTGMEGEFKIETDRFSKAYPAGSIISTGHITMVMKEAEKATGSLNSWTYKNTLTLENIRVTDGDNVYEHSCDLVLDDGTAEKTTDAVNVIERSGGYFNRIYIRKINPNNGMGTGNYYSTQELAPDANVPLGEEFGAYIFFTDVNENLKRSYDYITLWDNSLMEYRGFTTYEPNVRCFNNTYHFYAGSDPDKISFSFITKRKTSSNYNGGIWKNDNEMRTVNVDSFSDLCFFSNEESARAYGSICGIAAHIRGLPGTGTNTATFRFEILMRSVEGAEAGSTAMFCGVNEGSASPDEPIRGSANGRGTMPSMTPLRSNNTASSRLYEKSSFTSIGSVIPSSLTENNWVGAPGNSVWFYGNSVSIDERLEDGATSATYRLSEKKNISYDILPGFKSISSNTQKMNGRIENIIPEGLELENSYVKNKEGQYIKLENDTVYDVSDFVENGSGRFFIEHGNIPSGEFNIVNKANESTVLGTSSETPSHGTNVQLNTPGGSADIWELIPLGKDLYNIRSRTVRKATEDKNGTVIVLGLNLSYSTAAQGQNINVANPNNANGQKWIIEKVQDRSSDDIFFIRSNVDTDYVMAPSSDTPSAGTDVRLYTKGSKDSEKWKLSPGEGNDSEKLIIYYTDITAEGGFPEFRNVYSVDKKTASANGSITNIVSIYDRADPEAVTYENGKSARTGVSFTSESQYVLKKTVDKAVMERDDELTWTLTAQNLSGEPDEIVITDTLPEAELAADGAMSPSEIEYKLLRITSELPEGGRQWTYKIDGADYMSGTKENVKDIVISGNLGPGEKAVFRITVTLSGHNGGDYIRNMSSMNVREGGTLIGVASNKTETRVKGFTGKAEVYKSVDRISCFKGEDQKWTVSSTIPEDIYSGNGVYYEFRDGIDPERERLTYTGGLEVCITSSHVSDNEVVKGEIEEMLEKGVDYLSDEPDGGDHELTVSFTKAGTEKLERYAGTGHMVEVSFSTYINENGIAGEHIPNDVLLHYGDMNDPDDESVHPDETNPVTPYVYTGCAVVKKTDGRGQGISDAGFGLYTDRECLNLLDISSVTGRECAPEGETLTDRDGEACWNGLRDGTYYLKEESSPEGYELMTDAVKITVSDGYMEGEAELPYIKISENKSIPLMTGGSGRGGYYSGIIALSGIILIYRRRRTVNRTSAGKG